jgi:cytoskeleton protein RodZ
MIMANDEQAKSPGGPTQRSTSVGTTLRGARESRQLSIEHLAAELRIEPRHLQALETDRFDAIGVPVFTKGYLKQYGLRLGLDTADLLRRYQEQVEDDEVHLVARRPIQMPDARPFGFWLLALLALAVIGALVVFFVLGRAGLPTDFMPGFGAAAPPAEAIVEPPASSPAAAPGRIVTGGTPTSRGGAATPIATALSPEGGERAAVAEIVPVDDREAPVTSALEPGGAALPILDSTVVDPAVPTGETATLDLGATAPSTVVAPADSTLPAAARVARVELRFAAECWVEAIDATGERRYYGLGRAGDRAEFDAALPLDVLLGDAGAVTLQVNGEPYAVPQPRRGNHARFSVHPVEPL